MSKERRQGSVDQRYIRSRSSTSRSTSTDTNLTRRRLLWLAGGVVTAGAVGFGTCEISGNAHEKDSSETVYNKYLQNFEAVAAGDPEAEEYLRFFKEKRKKGAFRNGQVVALEEGNTSSNFWTATASKNTDLPSGAVHGLASFDAAQGIPRLILKDIQVDPLFSGVLLAHEAVHVKQWFDGTEKREDGFILGEVDAYTLEFNLLDKATNGRFLKVLKEESKDIAAGKFRGKLSDKNYQALSALFSPAKTEDDYGIRVVDFTIGINFASIESRNPTLEAAMKAKADYIRNVMNGQLPIMGKDLTPKRRQSAPLIF